MILQFGLVLLTSFCAWLIVYSLLIGIGLLVQFPFHDDNTVDDLLFSFWIGLVFVIVILMVWHLFLSITPVTSSILCAGGIVGLCLHRDFIRHVLSRIRHHLLWIVLPVVLCLLIVPVSVTGSYHFDDGLYHVQDVQWMMNYAIVPGLGNLQARFAFNTTHTLYVAFIEQIPLLIAARHLTHGTLIMAVIFHLVRAAYLTITTGDTSPADSFLLLALPVVIYKSPDFAASIKNDFPAMISGLIIAAQILRLLHQTHDISVRQIVTLSLLAYIAITIKLSLAIFSIGLLVILLYKAPRRTLLWSVPIGCLIIGIWMIRGIILSGYLLYPSDILPLPVDWLMPAATVRTELTLVRSWARLPGVTPDVIFADNQWIFDWWQINQLARFEFVLPLWIGIMAAIIRFVQNLRKPESFSWHNWILPAIGLIGLCYWWLTAPALRFGWHIFWTIGISLLLVVTTSLNSGKSIVLLLALCLSATALLPVIEQSHLVSTYPEKRIVEYSTQVTLDSYPINVPRRSQCLYIPVPCAPFLPQGLTLREPDNLQAGFRIEPQQVTRE